MTDTVRWGIISTARIARQFARDFAHAEGGELLAVASRTLEKAQDFADQYEIPRAYARYEDLLADPEIDAVYIATPHTLHYPNSLDAIKAGKAVLCEKPLTINPEDARSLAASAREAEVYLMEAMWTWLLPAIRTAKAWVDAGRIGKLLHIKADFGYPMPFDRESRVYARDLAGGVLLDMGIYPIALAWLFSRKDPESLQVRSHLAPNGVDDEVLLQYDLGDCRATLAASFRCKLPNIAWLIGDRGLIQIPEFWRARECYLYQGDEPADYFCDERAGEGFEFEIAAVNRDLLAGLKRPSTVTWEDSVRFQEHMALAFSRMSYQPVIEPARIRDDF
jgi:predicted dehydrogenase